MNEHLTTEQLESFGKGAAPPAELVRMDQHLARCPQCRSRIPFDGHLIDSLSVFKEDEDGDMDHLSYELIEAYVQSQVDDVDREIVTSHMAFCSECAERVQGLQKFVTTLSSPSLEKDARVAASPEPLSMWSRISATLKAPRWSYAIVGAAAAVLIIGVIVQRQGPGIGPGSALTSRLLGVDSMAPAAVSQVPDLLRQVMEGALPNPTLVPNRILVRTRRPTFRWEAADGANSYRVEILNGASSVMSDFVSGTEWSPDFDLERGRVYSWTVAAYTDGEPLSAVSRSAGTARFGIVSEEDERILSEAMARYPESHLVLASAYLRAGLIDDAERELNLVDSNESYPAPQLRNRIDGIRRAFR